MRFFDVYNPNNCQIRQHLQINGFIAGSGREPPPTQPAAVLEIFIALLNQLVQYHKLPKPSQNLTTNQFEISLK